MSTAKDLSFEAPRSPRERVGQYFILGRAIDKCRADLAGTIGDYHTDCPLDHMLLDWKGVEYAPFRAQLAEGADDATVAKWVDENGTVKTSEEVTVWNQNIESFKPGTHPEKRDWFVGECEPLGLDPDTATLFEYLETDDKKSFG